MAVHKIAASKGHAAKLRDAFNKNTKRNLGKLFKNKATGNEAAFSVKSQKELRSQTQKSKDNGFSLEEYFEVVEKIVDLYQNADFVKEHEDIKNNSSNLKIERYLSQEVNLKSGKKARACITVKHTIFTDGRLIYSVEVMDTKTALEKTRAKGKKKPSQ